MIYLLDIKYQLNTIKFLRIIVVCNHFLISFLLLNFYLYFFHFYYSASPNGIPEEVMTFLLDEFTEENDHSGQR